MMVIVYYYYLSQAQSPTDRSRAIFVTLTSSLQCRLPSGPRLPDASGCRIWSSAARARSLPSTDCRSMRPNMAGPRPLYSTDTYRYRPSPMTTRRSGGSGSLRLLGNSNSGSFVLAASSKRRSAREESPHGRCRELEVPAVGARRRTRECSGSKRAGCCRGPARLGDLDARRRVRRNRSADAEVPRGRGPPA